MPEIKTVNITPTWRGMMPYLVELAVNGTTLEARATAMKELYKLADAVDKLNEENKVNA